MKPIRLVNDLYVDIDNVAADFQKHVRAAFEEYTEETNPKYRFEDKLGFIDLCVNRLRGNEEDSDIVKRLVMENTEWQFDEYDVLPTKDDCTTIEFMEACVHEGRESASLHFCGNHGRIGEKKMRVLDLIIAALYADERGDKK